MGHSGGEDVFSWYGFRQAFKGPTMGDGKLLWKKKMQLTAVVVACQMDRKLRRHQYRFKWESGASDLAMAGVQEIVDDGFLEQYSI